MTEVMTATKALVELKLLDKRINSKINESLFVAVVRGEDKKTTQQVSIEDATTEIKAGKQSITALIDRRNAIKTALVSANARVTVVVGKKTYTVAEAIERKNSICYEECMLQTMKMQYASAVQAIEQHNQRVDIEIQNLLKGLGDAKTLDKTDVETTTKLLRKSKEMHLHDPIGIRKQIDEMESNIDQFKADVDTALSVINATTTITLI